LIGFEVGLSLGLDFNFSSENNSNLFPIFPGF